METDKIEPNKPALRAWVERLKSGVDQQGLGALCVRYEDGTEEMCCLGVATKMHAETLGLAETTSTQHVNQEGKAYYYVRWNDEQDILPFAVRQHLGVNDKNFDVTDPVTGCRRTIASFNDEGASFADLAAMIETEFDL